MAQPYRGTIAMRTIYGNQGSLTDTENTIPDDTERADYNSEISTNNEGMKTTAQGGATKIKLFGTILLFALISLILSLVGDDIG